MGYTLKHTTDTTSHNETHFKDSSEKVMTN